MSYNELQQDVLNYLKENNPPLYIRWYLPKEEIEQIETEDSELFEAVLLDKIIENNQGFIQEQTLKFLKDIIVEIDEKEAFDELKQTEVEDLLMCCEAHADLFFFAEDVLSELHKTASIFRKNNHFNKKGE